jgi:hypothetical protein
VIVHCASAWRRARSAANPCVGSSSAFIAGLTRGVAPAGTGVMFIVRVLLRGTGNTMQDRHEGDAEQVLDA